MVAPAAMAPSAAIAANGVTAAVNNAAISAMATTANGGDQANAPTAAAAVMAAQLPTASASSAKVDPMAAMLGVPAAELAEWWRNLATLAPLLNLLRLSTSASAAAQPENNGNQE